MAYYFTCETCNKKEFFNDTYDTERFGYLNTPQGKKQDYETVLCTSCVSRRVRLQGNHIIIK